MNPAPGRLVTENVRLIEPLSEGGMGSVWLAEHLGLSTMVAVKFIAAELLEDDPELFKRFRREASAAAQIKSPHVVQTLDHGVMDDGMPYIVMELLEGETLAERLARAGTLPLEQTAEIVTQAARGLGKAHGVGIVHRDIKPDNIFLVGADDEELCVKLLDFGVAKHTATASVSVVTSTGSMIGTPGYMSPEQVLTGKDVDHRSDLWSLGVVAYHALVGDIPFSGDTLGALCVSITRGDFTPPSELRDDLPETIDAWMQRSLALQPSDRFQSAKDMALAFREAMGSDAPDPSIADSSHLFESDAPTVARDAPAEVRNAAAAATVVLSEPPPPPKRRWLRTTLLASLGFSAGVALVLATWDDAEDDAPAPTAPAASTPTERAEESTTTPAWSAATPTSTGTASRPPRTTDTSTARATSTSRSGTARSATTAPRPPPPTAPAPAPPPPSSTAPTTKDRGF